MNTDGNGEFYSDQSGIDAGENYRFVLPDGTHVPDPASRYQPEDVSGPSQVVDPGSYKWNDGGWAGRRWNEIVLYELHTGTFTPEGTFDAAAMKLQHLADVGITAVELMCVGDFAGRWSWGYDSALLYAPDSTYGHPDTLKAFVDRAHQLGIAVILDVVYNHFGPEGNYLPLYFPELMTDRYKTPWGDALNFDEVEGSDCAKRVRELIICNALYWVREFHMDGLRLDAAHAIIDNSPVHVLEEMAQRVCAFGASQQPPRTIHLIREDEQNVADKLTRSSEGVCNRFTAQWNHDMSHLLGAAMRTNFTGDGVPDAETEKVAMAVAEGFVIASAESGDSSTRCSVPPTAFIAFVQTHDLVGNRIAGERIHALAPPEAVKAVMAVLLLGPQIPMIFMGDEYAASSPFPYFCDFKGDLGVAIQKGRCEFLAKLHNADGEALKAAPDPQAESTFQSAKLRWEEMADPLKGSWSPWYRRILAVRLQWVSPLLAKLSTACGKYRVLGPGAFESEWTLKDEKVLQVAANLKQEASDGFSVQTGEKLWVEGELLGPQMLGPWSVRWTVHES